MGSLAALKAASRGLVNAISRASSLAHVVAIVRPSHRTAAGYALHAVAGPGIEPATCADVVRAAQGLAVHLRCEPLDRLQDRYGLPRRGQTEGSILVHST